MKIQIFIDTICGWCFIGSQRLQSVLHKLRDDYEIIYVPFQLNPHMPLEG
jgi:Predicted dithiol-disulfide isomerase involved in polyketide biosynthesis